MGSSCYVVLSSIDWTWDVPCLDVTHPVIVTNLWSHYDKTGPCPITLEKYCILRDGYSLDTAAQEVKKSCKDHVQFLWFRWKHKH